MSKAEKERMVLASSATLKGLEGLVNDFFCSRGWVLTENADGSFSGRSELTGNTLDDVGCRVVVHKVRGQKQYRFEGVGL